jgi:arsenate reductase (thioredoxin)
MLRSKSWEEFAQQTSPPLDFVFTVCDKAAGEACPVWPGSPVTAHWGSKIVRASWVTPTKQLRVFEAVYRQLENRVKLFVNLRIEDLDQMSLRDRLTDIGRSEAPEPSRMA